MDMFRSSACTFAVTFCIFMLLLHKSSAAAHGNQTDRLALLAVKDRVTHDPMGLMSSWNHSVHFCQWQGVSCGHHHRRVTRLNLRSFNLVGSISPAIGNLSFLRTIDLSNNSFQGEIPHEIGKLFRLQIIALVNNSLEGQIPTNLSRCSKLRSIYLSANNFTGSIPKELGSLSHLDRFTASKNNLAGPIPSSFGNISSLRWLSIGLNTLVGRIPDSISNLKSLEYIDVSGNKLSGMVPPSIYNLSSLTDLWMADNQLEGTLPQALGLTLPNIKHFDIWQNEFSGSIPFSISNASDLEHLDLSRNKFSSRLAVDFGKQKNLSLLNLGGNLLGTADVDDLNFISTLTNCSKLIFFIIQSNNFESVFPNSITNLSTLLQRLALGENKFFGSIPESIANLGSLEILYVNDNQLTGSIPASIGKLYKLQRLSSQENKLSGQIPFSIGNLTLLDRLWLSGNNFQGSIPSSLGNCHSLLLLDLFNNNLSDNIPREVIGLSSLAIYLDLSWNRLIGPLPEEVGHLKNLVELDLSHNKLSERIPSNLGRCTSLEYLHLDHNSFEGAIPQALSSLRSLEELDLSYNYLSGEIPEYIGMLPFLRKLNLSFNNLGGEVPKNGAFNNTSVISIYGNKKLCGGIHALQLPACASHEPRKHKKHLELLVVVLIIFAFSGIILAFTFLIPCLRKKMIKQLASSTDSARELSYAKLLKATNGFSSINLIGSGSFGCVYKGILHPNEKAIAVKVLDLQRREASRSFMAECQALKNIKHRNLVKIINVCVSIDFQGNDFKALVYEFMENGSLESWLHHEHSESLNLIQRINIAIDVASALDYLHNRCHMQVIHCDIKPGNILLDGDMVAHISDFGIARLLRGNINEYYESQSWSVGIRGTMGYIAPEYGMGSDVSTNGDMYSYGILLLELFTGKRPTDDMFQEGLNLPKFVEMALPERVMEIVDQMLLHRVPEEEGTYINRRITQMIRRGVIPECLVMLLRVGVACSKESPEERMAIADVAKELHLIKEKLLGKRTRS